MPGRVPQILTRAGSCVAVRAQYTELPTLTEVVVKLPGNASAFFFLGTNQMPAKIFESLQIADLLWARCRSNPTISRV